MELIRAQVIERNVIKKLRYVYLNKGFGASACSSAHKYGGILEQRARIATTLSTYTNIARENITKDMW